MLDRRWLHGRRRLTVAAGITRSVPTLLRAWTSNPWSCPNHFSPFVGERNCRTQGKWNSRNSNAIPTDGANWWCFAYQWAEQSLMLLIKGLSVNPEKTNSKVRGDRWRPAKNPPMAKLVFSWFQMSKKCLNAYLCVDQCCYSTPMEWLSLFT